MIPTKIIKTTAFWAAALKGTKSCRTQGDFCLSVRLFVRLSPLPQAPQASNLAPQASKWASQARNQPCKPQISLLRPPIGFIRPYIGPK